MYILGTLRRRTMKTRTITAAMIRDGINVETRLEAELEAFWTSED
jgi:hypothetical protein